MSTDNLHILMIDNFDSFTYNLVHYIESLKVKITVKRNNEITIDEIYKLKPSHIIISPGPGTPDDAGISLQLVNEFKGLIPIMGVCLGHQVIAQAVGARICRAPIVMHGKTSQIFHNSQGLFKNLPQHFLATRYHSLVIDKHNLPKEVKITAWCYNEINNSQVIMGIEVGEMGLFGVQFHPESVASEHGITLMKAFVATKGNCSMGKGF